MPLMHHKIFSYLKCVKDIFIFPTYFCQPYQQDTKTHLIFRTFCKATFLPAKTGLKVPDFIFILVIRISSLNLPVSFQTLLALKKKSHNILGSRKPERKKTRSGNWESQNTWRMWDSLNLRNVSTNGNLFSGKGCVCSSHKNKKIGACFT